MVSYEVVGVQYVQKWFELFVIITYVDNIGNFKLLEIPVKDYQWQNAVVTEQQSSVEFELTERNWLLNPEGRILKWIRLNKSVFAGSRA